MILIGRIVQAILEMDHVETKVVGDRTIYTFKTTSIVPSLVEIKSKILSVLDAPFDIPMDVKVDEVKRGKIFKEYLVHITVPKEKVGKISDLIAKKYPLIAFRRRRYSGES